ncbi:uncharacterized protein LOC143367293 [Andrena cerasifolii]|uniref:uncharacterized protein LOC143367293 n=1 Tax=Andrena cerasifolii TaxID=2819439 RepID=UPI0040376F42
MNAFPDNPFFFFMDNPPPIFSADVSKNARKIVELSDTGCDARIPVGTVPPHTNRNYSSKSSKVKSNDNWKFYYEKKFGSKSCRERFRGESGRNTTHTGDVCLFPKENENIRQQHWQKRPTMEDPNKSTASTNDPENISSKFNERASSERTRSRRWKRDDTPCTNCGHDVGPQSIQNAINTLIEDHLYQPRKLPKASSGRAPFPCSNGFRPDPRIYNQEITDEERIRSLRAEYPEQFKSEEAASNSSSRERWTRSDMSTFYNIEHLLDESWQKSQASKKLSSAKSSDGARYWEDAHAARFRSRTCSPPADRRKRTRSVPKSAHQDVEQAQNQHISRDSKDSPSNAESVRLSSARSKERLKRFVNRAVDKDSIPDVLNVSTSTNHLPNRTLLPASIGEGKSKQKGGFAFWEFIPLEDEGDQKGRKMSLGSKDPLLTKCLVNDKDDAAKSKTKRRDAQKNVADEDSARRTSKTSNDSAPPSRPLSAGGSINNKKNHPPDSPRMQSTKPLVDSNEAKLSPKVASSMTRKNTAIPRRIKSEDEAKSESKNLGKIECRLPFSGTGKPSQYSKSPSSVAESEPNADKKKKVGSVALKGDKRPGMKIVEKVAACLKRKLEMPKEEASVSNSMMTQKKVRSEVSTISRLPVRIGNRVRSKNPVALGLLGNSKGQVVTKEESKGTLGWTEDSSSQQSSVRSRTKPRIRASINSPFVESVQASVEIQDSSKWGQNGNDRLVGDNTGDKLIDGVQRERSLSRTELPKEENLGGNAGEREIGDLKVVNVEQDQRKRDIANRVYGREINRRSNLVKEVDAGVAKGGFKGKCLFHLNGEQNIICNNYCNKEHRNLRAYRSGRSMAVKARI